MPGVEAFFLGSGAARRLAVCWRPPPDTEPRGALLHVPPLFEEMNKTRRMVAVAARALAQRGFITLRIDLAGCGDSAGRLAGTGWDEWIDDIALGWHWLRTQTDAPATLWSLRGGALLASAAQARLDDVSRWLLWQPVASGKTLLTQFLRLRVAADAFAIADASARATTARLMQSLQAGDCVDVAGYALPPSIALSLAQCELAPPPPGTRVDWLEVDGGESPSLAPASLARVDAWRAQGLALSAQAVAGPAFWQTQEIEDCPALVMATEQLMAGAA